MLEKKNIIANLIQIYSLTIKDIKLKTRYKIEFISEFIAPLLTLFFPFIIFNKLFNLDKNFFGTYYSKQNFLLFILLGYCVTCLIFLLWNYKDLFYDEKTWKTLNAIIIAPVRRINILIGYLLSGIIAKLVPISFIIVICYLLFPIPLINLFYVCIVLLCLSITFAGIGFMLGVFEIVNEDISATLAVGVSFISLVSCLYFPITIFPSSIQFLILMNPLYYYFDLLRLSWWAGINSNEALRYITIYHIIFVSVCTVLSPLFGSYLFLRIYKKYGTSGY
ncbi:MAG: ABC transporter permease [Promethearchaeota archaeon]